MIAGLGQLTILVALAVAAAGVCLSVGGALTGDAATLAIGRRSSFIVAALVVLAVILMEIALVRHDFSVRFVSEVGSTTVPLFFTIISLWSALEGSILLWVLLLSLYTVTFLLLTRGTFPTLAPWINAVLLGVSAFFLFVVAGPDNPFGRVTPAAPAPGCPSTGCGPNPLLQNNIMMGIHPVLLYFGYVGLTVPFAIAVATLISGRTDATVMRLLRRWAVVAWIFLSFGIVAGMWWSYEVLGWGGYWSWDPVENVAVMPWIVTTAFLHSLQVQERRQMLKVWTMTLVIAAFLLSVLGTFLTRSGIIESVHAFTQSDIGPYFLVFLGIVMAGSLALLFWRAPDLAAPGHLQAVVCREVAFMLNNLLLVALTFTILLGTLFPLIAETVQGSQLSVGAPYFDQLAVPLAVAILFLMGVGPLLPWGATRFDVLQWRLLPPVALGIAAVLALLLIGVRGIGTLGTFGLAVIVITVNIGRIVADVRSRQRSTSERWTGATGKVISANPRRYGGYLAHIGLILAIVGIAASQSYVVRAAQTLRPGQSMTVGGYTLTYLRLLPDRQSNRMVLGAQIAVQRGSQNLGTFDPSQNYYPTLDQPVVTPAVREEPLDMLTGLFQGRNPLPDLAQLAQGRNPFEDLQMVLQAVNTSNANSHNVRRWITLQVIVSPLIGLIWFGGAIIGLGGIVALVPARRRKRASVPVPALVREEALP
ncbi:MAG TPA: cytochrome c-type biogenesis CcmF C-terminal domain-containing protein [Chloroflexota bacterium]|nr:cytochrome c-type biogenesis CcmF C-terminal domain-containing protein [Chloroflexota bacterium]